MNKEKVPIVSMRGHVRVGAHMRVLLTLATLTRMRYLIMTDQ